MEKKIAHIFNPRSIPPAAVKYCCLLLLIMCLQNRLRAQIGKRILDRTRRETEYQVNKKIDAGIDKGVKKIDTLLTGKKNNPETKEPSKTETPAGKTGSPGTADADSIEIPDANKMAVLMNTGWVTDVIFTGINCEKGKRTVETKLRNTPGIKSAQVNVQTGELSISYFSSRIRYDEIIVIINQLSFDADGKKAAGGKNVCQ